MHVYYSELVEDLVTRLANIPVPFDLIITNASGRPVAVDPSRLAMMSHCLVLEMENHGRDIYPLAALVNADVLAPYQFILKVHTKRSEWRADHELDGTGDSWRTDLLAALLPEPDRLRDLLGGMVSHPEIGVVTAPGSVLDESAWGDNQPIAGELLRRLELEIPRGFRFAAGSMYWTRGFVLQGLRGMNLTRDDFEDECGQINFTTAHALERLIGLLACEAGLLVTDTTSVPLAEGPEPLTGLSPGRETAPRAKVVPFYLPQFHAVDQNDVWWGPGFTEWTNVTAAKPVFKGHWQPKLPREHGFYDLEDPRVLARHEQVATDYGLSGFMFYHYWFSGERILEAPLGARVIRQEGLPFCIMWANENWTRRWDGQSQDVLMKQDYSEVQASEFIESVVPELLHPDYITVDGRPLLAVYRPAQIPDLWSVVQTWREKGRVAGVGELHLIAVDVPGSFDGLKGSPQDHGFDGLMGFAPHNLHWTWMDPEHLCPAPGFAGNIFSYADLVADALGRLRRGLPARTYPGVMTGFDNTARRSRTPDLWYGSNPYTFRRWLSAAVTAVSDRPVQERIVFVNAWNEWAEGAMLEPSDKFGLSYLQAVRDVVM